MHRLAEMIDLASDTQDANLTDAALYLSELIGDRVSLSEEDHALLHYFRANAYENQLSTSGQRQAWDWHIPHLQNILLELRRAVTHAVWPRLDSIRRCQVYTNLANKLNSIGRPVEALSYWNRAIAIIPNFALALANRGYGLQHYGAALFDEGHKALFLLSAHDSFLAASDQNAIFDSPESLSYEEQFSTRAENIATILDIDAARLKMHREFSLGRSRDERLYRSWCLENGLFLNPLNDLGSFTIAAQDVLHLPSLTLDLDEGGPEPPAAFGFYNQLKQEFVSARWLHYDGATAQKAHFSDKDTYLYDTLSIPSYSLATEKTKLAFRMAYSLFDKIASFINDYFKVGLRERDVTFRSVWYQGKRNSNALSSIFLGRRNWPLRGLFWLSRDLFEPTFREVSEPDAEGLLNLRNYIEHKYCQVYEDMGMGYSRFATSQSGSSLGFRIGRDMLEAKSLHILKLARSALIYLSLAIYWEETGKDSAREEGFVAPMPLWLWNERRRL